jgi:hypothetical protein
VRNMLHISRITDLHLMLLYHCKSVIHEQQRIISWCTRKELELSSFSQNRHKSFHIFYSCWNHVKNPHMLMLITYQRSERWPWGPWIRLSSCTPFVDVNKNKPKFGHWNTKKAADVKQRALVSKLPFVSKSFFWRQRDIHNWKKICSPMVDE